LSLFDTSTGAVTYTPATNYNGPDFFQFTVSDGSLLATGSVAITVTPSMMRRSQTIKLSLRRKTR